MFEKIIKISKKKRKFLNTAEMKGKNNNLK